MASGPVRPFAAWVLLALVCAFVAPSSAAAGEREPRLTCPKAKAVAGLAKKRGVRCVRKRRNAVRLRRRGILVEVVRRSGSRPRRKYRVRVLRGGRALKRRRRCADRRDNDRDGKRDLADPGCAGPRDNAEQAQGPPIGDPSGIPARRAGDFLDSVGVNTHFTYGDTAYSNAAAVKAALSRLGVRSIRDYLGQGTPWVAPRFAALSEIGVRMAFITGDLYGRSGSGTVEEQLDNAIRLGFADDIEILEGPNEVNLNNRHDTWAARTRNWMLRLFEARAARPALHGAKIAAPSLGHPNASTAGYGTLGDISQWIDYGNVHTYSPGLHPDSDSTSASSGSYPYWTRPVGTAFGSKPLIVTEFGYTNALGWGDGGWSGLKAISERAAGIYVPRAYFDYFRRGSRRSYSYELVDERPDSDLNEREQHFGLFRNDWSIKPAGVAVERITRLLADSRGSFAPGRLDYTIPSPPSDLRHLLLQKRDGTFYLVLWRALNVYDPDSHMALDPPDVPTQVNLGKSRRVTVYRPNDSAEPVSAATTSTVTVRLGERVVILELR